MRELKPIAPRRCSPVPARLDCASRERHSRAHSDTHDHCSCRSNGHACRCRNPHGHGCEVRGRCMRDVASVAVLRETRRGHRHRIQLVRPKERGADRLLDDRLSGRRRAERARRDRPAPGNTRRDSSCPDKARNSKAGPARPVSPEQHRHCSQPRLPAGMPRCEIAGVPPQSENADPQAIQRRLLQPQGRACRAHQLTARRVRPELDDPNTPPALGSRWTAAYRRRRVGSRENPGFPHRHTTGASAPLLRRPQGRRRASTAATCGHACAERSTTEAHARRGDDHRLPRTPVSG